MLSIIIIYYVVVCYINYCYFICMFLCIFKYFNSEKFQKFTTNILLKGKIYIIIIFENFEFFY